MMNTIDLAEFQIKQANDRVNAAGAAEMGDTEDILNALHGILGALTMLVRANQEQAAEIKRLNDAMKRNDAVAKDASWQLEAGGWID